MRSAPALWILLLLCWLAAAAPARAQTTGPAITVIKIGVDGANQNDFVHYGQAGGIAAYSIATTSCNPGTQQVQWTSSDHPVIGQNFFRLKDGRFEHIGQSWLKHGFCAVNESGCGSCQSTPCSTLGIGCADTYWATLNDGQGGGPKYQVNATTGVHAHPFPAPTGPSTIRGRLQVLVSEIDPALNPGAQYYSEAQYVSAHTAGNGNGHIANSWRRLNVVAVNNILGGGSTVVNQPAPYAWKSADPAVTVLDLYNGGEGANPGARWCVAYKVTDLGGGTWRYDYVVQNVNSDRSAYSFALPVDAGVGISNVFFRDVEYHSGETSSNTNWTTDHQSGLFRWRSTQTFTENANANALRWGTMYSFGFVANAGPAAAQAQIQMFKPTGGGANTLFASVLGPNTCANPSITTGPQSQTSCIGGSASFSVTASGSGPFSYQWYHQGAPIPGATGSQHTIASVTAGDAGNYFVEVTNSCGMTPSGLATLGVIAGPPSIITSPASQGVCEGGPATFSVSVSGSGSLSLQWYFGPDPIPGATSNQHTIPNASIADAGDYSVRITNQCGTVTSATATLTVVSGGPTITSNPQSTAVCLGGNAMLSVGASGPGTLTYQWHDFNGPIPGATSSTYLIANATPADAGSYFAVVSNECGAAMSTSAAVWVNSTTPTIDTDPASTTACQGGDAFFVVAASGPAPLSYQWYHGPTLLPGANASSYAINGVTPLDAGDYRVEVSNACGTVQSAWATLEVLPPGCVFGSSMYQVSGTSDGSDWCLRLTHCGATTAIAMPGLPAGASAADIAQAAVAAIAAASPIGGCNVTAQQDPPGSASFRLTWTTGSLTLEVGDAGCTSFCTVTTMTACSFNPVLTQIGESPLEPGQSLCFCDGGHQAAPCANLGAMPTGCANSTGSGALLGATGTDSITMDDAVLVATNVLPGQPGLFFQGNNALANGNGAIFGDGHRCCGSNVVRLQVVVPSPGGTASTSVSISTKGGVQPGDNRCYQYWYRDPQGPCSSTFNLTNGYVVSWAL